MVLNTALALAERARDTALRLPDGGTSKSPVRDFGASKARKRVPRRSLVTDTVADPALTLGNYGTSSNPARKYVICSYINKLTGGGGSHARTRLRITLFLPVNWHFAPSTALNCKPIRPISLGYQRYSHAWEQASNRTQTSQYQADNRRDAGA